MVKKAIVCLVTGLPGWGSDEHYWDSGWNILNQNQNLQVFIVHPNPIGSHYDRACEIFAEIMGQKVDYGLLHAEKFHHHQFGRNFSQSEGLHHHWSANYPIHFVCHSMGANTIRVLQKMLANDVWGCGSNADWIKSITLINPILHGCGISNVLHSLTTKSYKCQICKPVGQDETCLHGKIYKAAKILLRTIRWALNDKLKLTKSRQTSILDWHLEHWSKCNESSESPHKAYEDGDDHTMLDIGTLVENYNIFDSTDNIIYEHTHDGFVELDKFISYEDSDTKQTNLQRSVHPKTYYLCLFSCATDASKFIVPSKMSPILWPFSAELLENSIPTLDESRDSSYSKLFQELATCAGSSEPYRDNDGMVNIINQTIPNHMESVIQLFPLNPAEISPDNLELKPGVWYIDNVRNWATNRSQSDNHSTPESSKFVWDHFDICWARTFLKPKREQLDIELQSNVYTRLCQFISYVNSVSEQTDA